MKKKKSPKPAARKKTSYIKVAKGLQIEVRERKFSEINLNPAHPDPIPGFVPTLPGPPGWMQKLNPGA